MNKTTAAIMALSGILVGSEILGTRLAEANAYSYGMQLCNMVSSGMTVEDSWRIIVEGHASGMPSSLNRGDPYAPWSPTKTWGGAIGAGIGAGISDGLMAVMQLRRMAPDIMKVTNANCPEHGIYLKTRKRRKNTNSRPSTGRNAF